MVRQEVDKKVFGCCELRLGCIFAASCRVFITIAATVVLFGTLFNTELQEFVLHIISDSSLTFCIVASIPISVITIRWSYWFIRGATASTVRPRNRNIIEEKCKQKFTVPQVNSTLIQRMNHYILLQFVTAVVLVLCFNIISLFMAMLEFYLMYYTALLIKQRKELLCESSLNDAETPPPQYDSCVNNTQLPTSTVHLESDVPFTQSQGSNVGGPDTNSSNNAAVDTNSSVEARREQNILTADVKESVESSVQNEATIREGNPITTIESEPKEKLGFEGNVGGEHVAVVSEGDCDSNVVAKPEDNLVVGSDENHVDNFETNPKVSR